MAGLNTVSGPIPTELGQLTRLTSLNLMGMNKLSGSVPTEIGQLANLGAFWSIFWIVVTRVVAHLFLMSHFVSTSETLNLDKTDSLTGTIPSEVCNLRSQGLTNLIEFCITSCETKCPPL